MLVDGGRGAVGGDQQCIAVAAPKLTLAVALWSVEIRNATPPTSNSAPVMT